MNRGQVRVRPGPVNALASGENLYQEESISAIEVLHLRTTAERYSVVPKSYSLCHTWQAAADFTVVSGPFQRRTLLRLAQTFTAVAVPWHKSGQNILTIGRIEEEAPPKKLLVPGEIRA